MKRKIRMKKCGGSRRPTVNIMVPTMLCFCWEGMGERVTGKQDIKEI
jgi:hypothetical protein